MTRIQIAGTWVDWADTVYGLHTGEAGKRVAKWFYVRRMQIKNKFRLP